MKTEDANHEIWLAEICKGECIEHVWELLGDEFTPPLREAVVDYDNHIRKLSTYARTVVAFAGLQIGGAVSFYANDKQFHIGFVSEIAVRRQFRGMDMGNGLMTRAMIEARLAGMTSIALEVRKDNVGAIRLYQSLGFAIEAERSELSYIMRAPLLPVD